jgi:hypothetical protein
MAVTLKQLQGTDIPEEHRRPGQSTVFQVLAENGETFHFASETEAAAKVVTLSEQEKNDKP